MISVVTTRDIARIRGVTRIRAWQIVQELGIPFFKVGNALAISLSDAETFLGSDFIRALTNPEEGSGNG